MSWRYIFWDHHVRTIKCLLGYHDPEEDLELVGYDVFSEWGMGYGRSVYTPQVVSVASSAKKCGHCGKGLK